MADKITAPINYPIIAGGKILKGGYVVFGESNVRPDPENPTTLKSIYLDSGLTLEAENPQGISSDGVFDQSISGVLFGATNDTYSVLIIDQNGKELSYIPEYSLSDANSAANAQQSATDAANSASQAAVSESNAASSATSAEALFTDFVNKYLGAFSSDPATDEKGNPPIEGSLYWNTESKTFKVYDSGIWKLPQDLGFGTAAYADAQTSPTDTTAGALMAVSAFGVGSQDLNDDGKFSGSVKDIDTTSFKRWIVSNTDTPTSNGAVLTVMGSDTSKIQLGFAISGSNANIYYRTTAASDDWQTIYSAANSNPNRFRGLANDVISTGIATSTTQLVFYFPVSFNSVPSSFTETGTFTVRSPSGTAFGTGLSGFTLSGLTSYKLARILVNASGLTAGDSYELALDTSSSSIIINE